jgi:hypothetical protein
VEEVRMRTALVRLSAACGEEEEEVKTGIAFRIISEIF